LFIGSLITLRRRSLLSPLIKFRACLVRHYSHVLFLNPSWDAFSDTVRLM
jgi:hypothetical protein